MPALRDEFLRTVNRALDADFERERRICLGVAVLVAHDFKQAEIVERLNTMKGIGEVTPQEVRAAQARIRRVLPDQQA